MQRSWVIHYTTLLFRKPDIVCGVLGWEVLEALGSLPLVCILLLEAG